jgi:hypothetical protein
MSEPDAPDAPSADDEESREQAADADDTLEPGAMPPVEEDDELTAY